MPVERPTQKQIAEEAGVSRTTVYRTLETLVGIGVLTKACSPGAAARFDAVTRRHHHLVCLKCETLIDVEDKSLKQAVQLPDVGKLAFTIQDYSIHFHGICAACRRRAAKKPPASGRGRSHKSTARGGQRSHDRRPSRSSTPVHPAACSTDGAAAR